MPPTMDAISSQLFALPSEQRMRLALALMESVETDSPAKADAEWSEEISRRIAAVDSGQVKTVAAVDVFRKLREIAPDR